MEQTEVETTHLSPLTTSLSPLNYKGIPYEKIVQTMLWKLGYGDAPAEGERNTALYTMSRYLRFICDFDEQKLFQILLHWGLSDHEVMTTIKSAVSSVRPTEIPLLMKEVLTSMGTVQEASAECVDDAFVAPVDDDLPGILQEIADHAPEEFKEASLQHRISKDSFSGKVTLYYNILMCGTPNKCRAFFADVESGLVSRVTPVVLPDMVGAKMPKFKIWTKEEEEKVKRQCLWRKI